LVSITILAVSLAAAQTAPKKSGTTTKKAVVTRPSLYRPSSLHDRAPEQFRVRFTTTKGDVVLEVTRAMAPLGADRFYNLTKYGFYNGNGFFRVVPGFVVQFGLSPVPAVNAAWENAKIQDDPVQGSNSRGTLCFATSGANTRTTQLFINLGNNTPLDGQGFAPFGRVVEGMELVDQINAAYGQTPNQDLITKQGAAYLKTHFPGLDYITKAIIEAPPAAPAK
jgi:peptidyl-prolyl cis-trans isomerase A (cyclophilin A)